MWIIMTSPPPGWRELDFLGTFSISAIGNSRSLGSALAPRLLWGGGWEQRKHHRVLTARFSLKSWYSSSCFHLPFGGFLQLLYLFQSSSGVRCWRYDGVWNGRDKGNCAPFCLELHVLNFF